MTASSENEVKKLEERENDVNTVLNFIENTLYHIAFREKDTYHREINQFPLSAIKCT